MPTRVKIVMFVLLLLGSCADANVFGMLQYYSATRATVIKTFGDNAPIVNKTNSKPQPTPSNCYTIITYANGTKDVVYTSVDPNTLPPNATEDVFVTVYDSLKMGESISGSLSHVTIDYHVLSWAVMENVFEFLQYAGELANYALLCIFCAMFVNEIEKRATPRWLPLIADKYVEVQPIL